MPDRKNDIALKTTDTYEKGVLWENIAEYVINHISGWRITGRRVRAGFQEIDLSIANVSLDDDLWQLGSYVLVECKNWKRRVDIPRVRNIAYISAMKGNKTALSFQYAQSNQHLYQWLRCSIGAYALL